MTAKPLRADAARNRARLLEVAFETFAAEGLSVPIDEIARRAGVGAGTVYRHFPTKDDLFRALVADRLDRLVVRADELAASAAPGEGLFAFLSEVIDAGAVNVGLTDALAGIGFDIAEEAPDAEAAFLAAIGRLLEQAQQAGAVRSDLDVKAVKTLIVGCQAMQRYSGDADRTTTLLSVIRAGLKPS